MGKLEYIPGDLAMINGDIVKIMAVCFNYNLNIIQNYDVMFPNGNIYKYEAESLKEIPITPEILEKNGWKKDKEDYINDSYHLHLCGKHDGYSVYRVVNDNNVVWLTGVRNISDLQHLFFGLGLNSEMEV